VTAASTGNAEEQITYAAAAITPTKPPGGTNAIIKRVLRVSRLRWQ